MNQAINLKGKFPNGLSAALEASGMTKAELARQLETARQNVTRWVDEAQKIPLPMARKMAPLLNTTTAAILVPSDKPRELERVPLGEEFGEDPVFTEDRPGLDIAARIQAGELLPGEVPERNVVAGLGQGGQADEIRINGDVLDGVRDVWRVPVPYLHTELRAREGEVDFIAVDGDSMVPTLLPGDRVMINRSQKAPSPDGLYAIFDGIGISVKRLEIIKGSSPLRLRIISDNSHHKTDEIAVSDLHVVGRVICRVTRC